MINGIHTCSLCGSIWVGFCSVLTVWCICADMPWYPMSFITLAMDMWCHTHNRKHNNTAMGFSSHLLHVRDHAKSFVCITLLFLTSPCERHCGYQSDFLTWVNWATERLIDLLTYSNTYLNPRFKPRQFNSRTLIASHTVSLKEINEYDKLNIIRKCAINVRICNMFAKLGQESICPAMCLPTPHLHWSQRGRVMDVKNSHDILYKACAIIV